MLYFPMLSRESISEQLLVIYPNDHNNFEEELFFIINEVTNTRLPPSRILIICRFGLRYKLENAYQTIISHVEDRLRNTTNVCIAPYGDDGFLNKETLVHLRSTGETWEISDDLLRDAGKCGMQYLVENTNTILEAPPGYKFTKPSSDEETFFIRAGNMLSRQDAIAVTNHLLLRRLSHNVKTIYIDSFTILSFAMGLQGLLGLLTYNGESSRPTPSITNFRSYAKEERLLFPDEEDYIIIISASTSGNLAKDLVNTHGANKQKIVHLLGASQFNVDEDFRNSCLYFHVLKEREIPTKLTTDTIDIVSDEFAVSHGRPRPVNIGKVHIDLRQARLYADTFYQTNLRITKAGTNKGYGPYSVFEIMSDTDLGSAALSEWLHETLIHELPASADFVISMPDPRSRLLTEKVVALLCSVRSTDSITTVSVNDLDSNDIPNQEGTAAIIVASEDPNLEGLTKASTSLRKCPRVHRHYVVLHAFPETEQRYDRMVRDLTTTSRNVRYGWSQFITTAVGRTALHESVLTDYGMNLRPEDFEQHVAELGADLYSALQNRSISISQDTRLPRNIFFPRWDGSSLVLRPDSIFFEGEYGSVSQENAYLAVAAALQRARERRRLVPRSRPEECFDENPFVRSVISPVMFSRYSDGILQAALLRALAPKELDYSGDDELSCQFAEIVKSVIIQYRSVTGEAAVEFIAALASKKISLRAEEKSAIEETIQAFDTLRALWTIFSSAQNPIL